MIRWFPSLRLGVRCWIKGKEMTPVIEALLVAFLAGTIASVVSGYINRGIARVKRRRKLRKRPRPDNDAGETSS